MTLVVVSLLLLLLVGGIAIAIGLLVKLQYEVQSFQAGKVFDNICGNRATTLTLKHSLRVNDFSAFRI